MSQRFFNFIVSFSCAFISLAVSAQRTFRTIDQPVLIQLPAPVFLLQLAPVPVYVFNRGRPEMTLFNLNYPMIDIPYRPQKTPFLFSPPSTYALMDIANIPFKNNRLPHNIVSGNYYIPHTAFFCRQEYTFEKRTGIALRVRAGALGQCDFLEGKTK